MDMNELLDVVSYIKGEFQVMIGNIYRQHLKHIATNTGQISFSFISIALYMWLVGWLLVGWMDGWMGSWLVDG